MTRELLKIAALVPAAFALGLTIGAVLFALTFPH